VFAGSHNLRAWHPANFPNFATAQKASRSISAQLRSSTGIYCQLRSSTGIY